MRNRTEGYEARSEGARRAGLRAWSRWAVLAVLGLLLAGCAGRRGAEDAGTSPRKVCADRDLGLTPLVVAAPASVRRDLGLLRADGAMTVRYRHDGCDVTMEVLPNCVGKAKYSTEEAYFEQTVVGRGPEGAAHRFPVGARPLAAFMSESDAVRAKVETMAVTSLPIGETFSRKDLDGADCGKATHVVAHVEFGAYVLSSGEASKLQGDVYSMPQGVSHRMEGSDGCSTMDPELGCAVPVRAILIPIDGKTEVSAWIPGSSGDDAILADGEIDRTSVSITVFTDVPDVGERVAAALMAQGYGPVDVMGEPNDELNIKWGQARPAVVADILEVVSGELGIDSSSFEPLEIFGPDDPDVFINLRGAAIAAAGGDVSVEADPRRSELRVVVFADDPRMAEAAVSAIRAAGYGDVSSNSPPNPQFNIKWGAADRDLVEELVAISASVVDVPPGSFERLQIFDSTDTDVFINLPSDPELVRGAKGPIPQECAVDDSSADYGPVSVGAQVILGRHRMYEGSDNWAEDMAEYVGRTATVTSQSGTDASGCPGVRVDIDGGMWFWRIRDLSLP